MSLNILRVKDVTTKKLIPKVKVDLTGYVTNTGFTETDAAGNMGVIALPLATYHVKLTKEGYTTMEFDVTPWAPFHFVDVYM